MLYLPPETTTFYTAATPEPATAPYKIRAASQGRRKRSCHRPSPGGISGSNIIVVPSNSSSTIVEVPSPSANGTPASPVEAPSPGTLYSKATITTVVGTLSITEISLKTAPLASSTTTVSEPPTQSPLRTPTSITDVFTDKSSSAQHSTEAGETTASQIPGPPITIVPVMHTTVAGIRRRILTADDHGDENVN